MVMIRAQVILPTFSSLPEHDVTNTFHFQSAGALDDTVATAITLMLSDFYDGVDGILSRVVAVGDAEVKYFDITAAPPRDPWNPGWGFPISPNPANGGLPEEYAIVLSLHAALPHSPRRRGRLYLGPLSDATLSLGTTSAFCAVAATTVSAIATAAEALMDASQTASIPWCIYSPTDDVCREVTGGWVDNSPDTQRRRGHDATSRTLWGAPSA